ANVRAHTPAGTPASISVDRNGSWAEVTIADTGPGISTEDQARVFDRFWSGDPARGHSAGGGTGLGLSIVEAPRRAHAGPFLLQRELGHGAAFRLRLPLWHNQADASQTSSLRSESGS